MADETHYGVYVSIRTPDGLLWSSSRSTWAEVKDDIAETFGREVADAIPNAVASGFEVEAPARAAGFGPSQAQPAAPQQTELPGVMTPAEIAEAMGGDVEVEDHAQFDKCEVCGVLKDKWVPPGVSKAGKSYPGFWGCPNLKGHPRR